MTDDKSFQAVVEKVSEGRHGPYAVAKADGLGLVTFSLQPPVWKEKDWPEAGTCVVLTEIRKKRLGWRAMKGRYFRPSDEHQHQNQKGALE